MTRSIRRAVAVVIMATTLVLAAPVSADAGELCLFASKTGRVERLNVCLPTWF